jgi:Uma2 family endonuclease
MTVGDTGRDLQPGEISLEAWADLDEDESGELIDGRLVEEEMPSYLHEWIVAWLMVQLGSWIFPRGGGVVPSEIKLAVRPRRGRKADLVVHLPGVRLPDRRSALLREPPSIVVEVISPRPRDAKRDRVDKLDEYAAFRVPWYWIVDPQLRTLEIYELGADGRYARALGAGEGTVAIPACEGLTLDLDALWAHADRLTDESPERES